jgi:DNA processing protein
VFGAFDRRFSPVPPAVEKLIRASSDRAIAKEIAWSQLDHRNILYLGDSNYPSLLKELSDPPFVLFTWGDASCLDADQLSIVGSRRPTSEGRKIAEQFASDLVGTGFTITSGLAFGIDGAAHLGALSAEGKTVAVQGCGAGDVYPRHHEQLARQILNSGCLVTEYPPGLPALPRHFPQRNRIVTGLSRGTLVVEAAPKSGSLISARLAMEQGREVFAVPGSVRSMQSEGCHQLIRQGAKLVSSVLDIVEEFHDFEVRRSTDAAVSEEERRVLAALENGPLHADRIHELVAIDMAQLIALLMELEIKGAIQSGASGYVLSSLS